MKFKNHLVLGLMSFVLNFLGCQMPALDFKKEAQLFKSQNESSFHTIKFKNKTLHYVIYGNKKAQPVMFVHGSPGSWSGWIRFLKDSELNTNFLIIAVDRLGYGGSEPGRSEPSLDIQAEALNAILIEEKLSHVILVGHSLGGPVIARMAMNHSENIFGLVFVAASVSPELEKTKWFQYPAQLIGIRNIIPTDLRVCNEEILPLKNELTAMLPLWNRIKSKTIIIHGEKDDLVPVANKDFILQHIEPRYIENVVIDSQQNHFIPWSKPELIKKALFQLTQLKNTN